MSSDIEIESLTSSSDEFVSSSLFKKKKLDITTSIDTPLLRKGITNITIKSSSSNSSSKDSSNTPKTSSKTNSEFNFDDQEEVDEVQEDQIENTSEGKEVVEPWYSTIEPNPTSLENLTDKQLFINQLRLKFSKKTKFPSTNNMIDELGFINQSYFRPNLTQLQHSLETNLNQLQTSKWTEAHKLKLIQGIEEFGIGNFKLISDKYLKDWSVNDLRLKTIRLIGRQNLQLYKNWKGNQLDIEKEYSFNKQVGLEFNTWKNNNLVYDDNGLVLKRLLEHHNI